MGEKNTTLDSGLLCLFFVLSVRLLLHFPCVDDKTFTMRISFLFIVLEGREWRTCPVV